MEQKITPKKQSWSPRHVEKMMHYTSQKIAPFQALISSKLHSVQSWHLFCQPKTVSFTNPQVHGPPNPLLYRELDCIQIVIWPAQAILGLFTDLHPYYCITTATNQPALFEPPAVNPPSALHAVGYSWYCPTSCAEVKAY